MNLINEVKIEYFLILPLILFAVIFFQKKNNFLIDDLKSSRHKVFTGNLNLKTPLSGGIFIMLSLIIFLQDKDIIFFLYLALMTTIGILSDLNKLRSPNVRLILQLILVYSFIYIVDLNIKEVRIDIIDNYLDYKFISIIFTIFCILILLNGSNFIDGLNNLQIGYYILVLISLLILSNNQNLILNYHFVYLLLCIFFTFYIFNFFGKCFLGDGGSYLIAAIFAFLVINFVNNNARVSPYFIILLLWYPAFENFFSIIRRKVFNKKNASVADNQHLHQLILIKVRNVFPNNKLNNTISGNLIVLFNAIPFYFGLKYYQSTQILSFIIYFNILVYVIIYFNLKKTHK
jgi:UDP-N-acetylmuramyl pentapeptide phosphotransferase/UDP-N-acetylglucosamine-1-phosphate transferase